MTGHSVCCWFLKLPMPTHLPAHDTKQLCLRCFIVLEIVITRAPFHGLSSMALLQRHHQQTPSHSLLQWHKNRRCSKVGVRHVADATLYRLVIHFLTSRHYCWLIQTKLVEMGSGFRAPFEFIGVGLSMIGVSKNVSALYTPSFFYQSDHGSYRPAAPSPGPHPVRTYL